MKIETKFNQRDLVFFMREDKIRSGIIMEFSIECRYKGNSGGWGSRAYPVKQKFLIRESIPNNGFFEVWLEEDRIFSTKEELIKSIL